MIRMARLALSYTAEWMSNPARWRGRPALPTVLNLPITDNCNSRCVMCDVWKTKSTNELTPDQLRQVLSDRLFAKVRHVGISGGEPTLRKDLFDVVQVVLATLPSLRSLSITSHGFHPKRWENLLPLIHRACVDAGVEFRLNLSLDGIGPVHDAIRNIPGGFGKTIKTAELAKRQGINVQFQTTVSQGNVYNVGQILDFAREFGVEVVFRKATQIARLDNHLSVLGVDLDDDAKSFFADFVGSVAVAEVTRTPARRLYYKDLAHRLTTGAPRSAPCMFQSEGVLLTAHGKLYHCSVVDEPIGDALEESAYALYFSRRAIELREKMLKTTCTRCIHDQSGAWRPDLLIKEVIGRTRIAANLRRAMLAVTIGARAAMLMFKTTMHVARTTHGNRAAGARCAKGCSSGCVAVLIGAYGGEHVGDAAILGGVLLRLHKRFQIRKALVASTRPDRTRRWLSSLEMPVAAEVVPYSRQSMYRALHEACYLVHAGGPLMDIPQLLTRHLAAAAYAKRRRIPIVFEGIGIGPFRLAFSRIVARRLLRMADDVVVRTHAAARSKVVRGITVAVAQDPAFDYLESRDNLTKVTRLEEMCIQTVLSGADNQCRIGINLRPLWNKYSKRGNVDVSGIESRVLRELSAALARTSEDYGGRITFVYFPMNADQYGFSDLTIGYHLLKLLPPTVDFRIAERELGVDAVLMLLQKMHGVIAMRFHACIFARSQRIPTVGIDYSIGSSGKVLELFEDQGDGENVIGVENIDASWLTARLRMIVGHWDGTVTNQVISQ